jgi:hypothetical protein
MILTKLELHVSVQQDLAESVRDTLPGFSFSPMVHMLSKFLGFMNLTVKAVSNVFLFFVWGRGMDI